MKASSFPLGKISIVAPLVGALKMSGRLSHFCGKINFAVEPKFMAELETAHNANNKGTRVLMILGAKRS